VVGSVPKATPATPAKVEASAVTVIPPDVGEVAGIVNVVALARSAVANF